MFLILIGGSFATVALLAPADIEPEIMDKMQQKLLDVPLPFVLGGIGVSLFASLWMSISSSRRIAPAQVKAIAAPTRIKALAAPVEEVVEAPVTAKREPDTTAAAPKSIEKVDNKPQPAPAPASIAKAPASSAKDKGPAKMAASSTYELTAADLTDVTSVLTAKSTKVTIEFGVHDGQGYFVLTSKLVSNTELDRSPDGLHKKVQVKGLLEYIKSPRNINADQKRIILKLLGDKDAAAAALNEIVADDKRFR